jgi:hypothetical protein
MNKLQVVIAILMLLAGCAAPEPDQLDLEDTMYVSTEFSDEEIEDVVAAANGWGAATSGFVKLNLVIKACSGNRCIRPVRANEYGKTNEFAQSHFNSDKVEILIDGAAIRAYVELLKERVGEELNARAIFREVIMHELGHAYGLGHTKHGLMASKELNGDCIDRSALAEFCALRGCDVAKVNPTCE